MRQGFSKAGGAAPAVRPPQRTCLPKKHMPMLFHSCGELGVSTAATRYLTSATSMSEWSCVQTDRQVDVLVSSRQKKSYRQGG